MSQTVQVNQKTLQMIAQDVLAAWQQNHGTDNGRAYALSGMNCLLVFVEDAFSQAELHLAEQENSSTLHRYAKGLLRHICAEQVGRLQTRTGKTVVSTSVSADPTAGWVLCLFKFGAETGGTASQVTG